MAKCLQSPCPLPQGLPWSSSGWSTPASPHCRKPRRRSQRRRCRALPGPCTWPGTSWRTSAICLMTWLTSWMQCWTEACSFFPFPASVCSVSEMGEEWISTKRCLQVPPAAPSLHFAPLLGLWMALLIPHVTESCLASCHRCCFPRELGIFLWTGRRRAQEGCASGGHGGALAPLH